MEILADVGSQSLEYHLSQLGGTPQSKVSG